MYRHLAKSAVIAALYAALTLLLSPLSFGAVQLRVSEALCVLAFYSPAAVPGLAAGCFLANVLGPNGIVDALIGTAATLIAAIVMNRLGEHRKYLGLAVNSLINGVFIGLMLYYFYGESIPALLCVLWVTLGEAASCFAFGLPLNAFVKKHSKELGL